MFKSFVELLLKAVYLMLGYLYKSSPILFFKKY